MSCPTTHHANLACTGSPVARCPWALHCRCCAAPRATEAATEVWVAAMLANVPPCHASSAASNRSGGTPRRWLAANSAPSASQPTTSTGKVPTGNCQSRWVRSGLQGNHKDKSPSSTWRQFRAGEQAATHHTSDAPTSHRMCLRVGVSSLRSARQSSASISTVAAMAPPCCRRYTEHRTHSSRWGTCLQLGLVIVVAGFAGCTNATHRRLDVVQAAGFGCGIELGHLGLELL